MSEHVIESDDGETIRLEYQIKYAKTKQGRNLHPTLNKIPPITVDLWKNGSPPDMATLKMPTNVSINPPTASSLRGKRKI